MRKDVRDVAELVIVDILADGSQELVFGNLDSIHSISPVDRSYTLLQG
jgi:hypothetical protein